MWEKQEKELMSDMEIKGVLIFLKIWYQEFLEDENSFRY